MLSKATAARARQKPSDGLDGGLTAALAIAGAVGLLALPSVVLGFSSRLAGGTLDYPTNPHGDGANGEVIDSRLTSVITARLSGARALFRFTPAGLAARPDRLVTVAVRVDPVTARAIIVRASARPLGFAQAAANAVAVRLAPAAYNPEPALSYQALAPAAPGFVLPSPARRLDAADFKSFSLKGLAPPSDGLVPGAPARLVPQLQLNEHERPGRAPRTLQSFGEESLDVGGSYRLTRNLNVTAGVRYSEDRDRLKPLTDGKQDSQALFVGTQFRF